MCVQYAISILIFLLYCWIWCQYIFIKYGLLKMVQLNIKAPWCNGRYSNISMIYFSIEFYRPSLLFDPREENKVIFTLLCRNSSASLSSPVWFPFRPGQTHLFPLSTYIHAISPKVEIERPVSPNRSSSKSASFSPQLSWKKR